MPNNSTIQILVLIILMFLTIAINFFIMANKINENHRFMKIIIIFTQYIFLLYSILFTFAILYSSLSNIFNEGIREGSQYLTNWDALYFSATTFFTIGFGDITPNKYSHLTKLIVMIQAVIGHLITTVFWPIIILFTFKQQKTND